MRILVIADDLTGAAEIAGIGWRFGLPTRLLREPLADAFEGLTVVDTDSRSLAPTDAAAAVRRFVAAAPKDQFGLIYKKIDSVLRGPVMAEIDAMARAIGRESALLLPQNPSRGRTIQDGEYRINGVPLHLSEFGRDPEYPARTSNVAELLGHARLPVTIANAGTREEVAGWTGRVDATLPVGGADFFTALLESRAFRVIPSQHEPNLERPMLLACGSVAKNSQVVAERARREGVGLFPVPTRAEEWDDWIGAVGYGLKRDGRAVMMSSGLPATLRVATIPRGNMKFFASAVRDVVILADPRTILIEGGATAAAVCEAMRWRRFEVESELAPGVVTLRPRDALLDVPSDGVSWSGPRLIVKPGSYLWPEAAWTALSNV